METEHFGNDRFSLSRSRVQSLDIRARWHIAADDFQANDARRRLESAWRNWPYDARLCLLEAVEAVAGAEKLKSATCSQRRQARQKRAAKLVIDALEAARLATRLQARFQDTASPAIFHEIVQLAALSVCVLEETSKDEQSIAAVVARARLDDLAKKTHRRVPNELLAELVWLVAGTRSSEPLNESSIRRYGKNCPSRVGSLVARRWKMNWGLMRKASRLVSNRSVIDGLRREVRAFLDDGDSA